jgi:hypothetical protein
MLTRNRALLGILAASFAANAGCDFGGSNTPPSEPDLTIDGSPDGQSPSGDATPGATHDASSEASTADATVDGASVEDAGAATDATPADALPGDSGVDAVQAEVEAGIDATVDAGTDAGVDASPAVVDAADGATIDAPLSPIVVTITGPTGPESGISVVFHDPSGTQLGVATTDATGTVSMLVPAGSMATAIFGTPDQSTLVSIAAVQPGDVIALVDPTVTSSFSASPTIHLPDSTAPEGTDGFEFIVADGCTTPTGLDTSGTSVDIESTCVGPNGLFPALVIASDEGGSPLAFAFKDDNPSGADGGATPDVTLTGSFISTFGTETIETTNTDPDGLVPVAASVRQIADGVGYTEQQAVTDVQGDGSSQTIFTIEPGFASAVQTEVDVQAYDNNGNSLVAAVSREAAPALSGTDSFDMSQLPPEITNATIDASNVETPNIEWDSSSPLSNGTSGVVLSVGWTGLDGENPQTGTWILIVPSTATSVSPPALSDSVAGYSPAGDSEWTLSGVVAVGGSLAPDYDAFRGFVGGVLTAFGPAEGTSLPVVPVLPANGTLVASFYPVVLTGNPGPSNP